MSEQIDDLFASQEEPSSSNYILTSKRYLLRILDIGLITPELTACNKNGKFAVVASERLADFQKMEGYPAGPVLIQIKQHTGSQSQVISANEIESIHFPTEDDRDDYLSRQFENVPNELFELKATPALFSGNNGVAIELEFPKLNKQELAEKYRNIDMFAGMFWYYLENESEANNVKGSIAKLLEISLDQLITIASEQVLIPKSTGVTLDDEITPIFTGYLNVIAKYPQDEGWVAKDILESLKYSHAVSGNSELFIKWWEVSNSIVKNERELIPLTDDKQIVLRAMLLHLLNPEKEAIERMANRGLLLGEKVKLIAHYLAAAREGFAAMSAKHKIEKEGAYFLTSCLIATAINKTNLSLDNLIIANESDTKATLTWNGMMMGRFTVSAPIINEAEAKVEVKDINNGIDLQALVTLFGDIGRVSTAIIEDDYIYIVMDKKSLKPVTLPKHTAFSLKLDKQEIVCNVLLLDLSIASHGKKLTGPKMRAMLEYQTEKGKDFSFNLIPEQSLQASIRLPSSYFDAELAEKTLQQLIDAQMWMKS